MTENATDRIQRMIAELDTALHNETYARDQTPKEVWEGLLEGVRLLKSTTARINLDHDLASLLNYWGVDDMLSTPDFVLSAHLVRHLNSLKFMLEEKKKFAEDVR